MDYTKLKDFFLFNDVNDTEVEQMTKGLLLEVRHYEKHQHILSSNQFEEKIGFILQGQCSVYKTREKEDILLQTLTKNDSFGILTLFSKEDYPTLIVAKKPATVVFFTKTDFLDLINKNAKVALNVITFLANKVSFLNKKIATLSGATVEEKVENYLRMQYQAFGVQFDFNAMAVAGQINVGRASLYRVLNKLEENQIIQLDTKKIIIKNLAFFERSRK